MMDQWLFILGAGVILGLIAVGIVNDIRGTPEADRKRIEAAMGKGGRTVLEVRQDRRSALDRHRHWVTWTDETGKPYVVSAAVQGNGVRFTDDAGWDKQRAAILREALLAENRRLRAELERLEMGGDDERWAG